MAKIKNTIQLEPPSIAPKSTTYYMNFIFYNRLLFCSGSNPSFFYIPRITILSSLMIKSVYALINYKHIYKITTNCHNNNMQ